MDDYTRHQEELTIREIQQRYGDDTALEVARMVLHHRIEEMFIHEKIKSDFVKIRELTGLAIQNPVYEHINWFEENRDQIYGIPKQK
jgi:hypothetical protein